MELIRQKFGIYDALKRPVNAAVLALRKEADTRLPANRLRDRLEKTRPFAMGRRGHIICFMRLSAILPLGSATISIAVIAVMITPALSQAPPSSARSVRISGRLVSPVGEPVRFDSIRLSRSDDFRIDKIASAGADGEFSFVVGAGQRYRISFGPGTKSPSKVVDTSGGTDVNVGDIKFEPCPLRNFNTAKRPATAPMRGSLQRFQIVVEPQLSLPAGKPFPIAPVEPPPYKYVEPPQCWGGGASADDRAEWEGLGVDSIEFDRHMSIEEFVGGKVKCIDVTRHDPWLTPDQVRDEVRKVWLGIFSWANSTIMWAEMSSWNIAASVEFEDGKHTSLVTDGGHIQVQDRAGNYWYIRLGD